MTTESKGGKFQRLRPNLPSNLARVGLVLSLGGAGVVGASRILEGRDGPFPQVNDYKLGLESKEILETLPIKIVGEIRNGEDTLRGYFVEVNNPHNSAVDWWIQSTEFDNQGSIVEVNNFGPGRPPVGDPALDPDTYGDLWSYWGGPVMVPAGGSAYLEVPLINGSQAQLEAFTGKNSNREFWGLRESSDINLVDQNIDGKYLQLKFRANDTAIRGIVQTQIVLIKNRQVVDIMYSNTSEFNPMLSGEESRLTFDLSNAAPYDSFEVHFLPLQKDH